MIKGPYFIVFDFLRRFELDDIVELTFQDTSDDQKHKSFVGKAVPGVERLNLELNGGEIARFNFWPERSGEGYVSGIDLKVYPDNQEDRPPCEHHVLEDHDYELIQASIIFEVN